MKDEPLSRAELAALKLTDTDRLNALFTLMGGHYAFSPFLELNALFRKGRKGIDELIAQNPSLLGTRRRP